MNPNKEDSLPLDKGIARIPQKQYLFTNLPYYSL